MMKRSWLAITVDHRQIRTIFLSRHRLTRTRRQLQAIYLSLSLSLRASFDCIQCHESLPCVDDSDHL